LLTLVARRLRESVRDDDVVSRFGGDEFLILCRSDLTAGLAESVCERVRAALAQPFQLDAEQVLIGASLGAVVTDGAVDAEDLIRRADRAMYMAKQNKSGVPALNIVVA
jgi:diguanylate cyclase (GGDEF)-like protein